MLRKAHLAHLLALPAAALLAVSSGGSPGTRHAGDLPNISTDSEGKARIRVSSHLLGVGSSEFSVLGRSLVLHSDRDDYTSQPAGGSGERIACGVIQPAEG